MPDRDSPFRFARMHGEIERRLEDSGMAFTHLRAGEFMHAYFRQVPSIVAKGAIFLPMEDAKIASIDIGDIAEVAAPVLTSAGTMGKAIPSPVQRLSAWQRWRKNSPLQSASASSMST